MKFLKKICFSILLLSLSLNVYADIERKVKISTNDSTAGFLNGKLIQGTNMTFTENNDGGNETLTLASTGTGYSTVQEEGSGLTQQDTLNFIGSTITCVDNGGSSRTDCTLTSASTIIVQEADATVDASATTLDFGAGFDVTSSPSGEANVLLDYTEDPVNLNSSEITGELQDANIADNLTATSYLLLAGGTLTGQLITDNLGVEFAESDTNPTCAAGNFNIFADLSENTLKKCINGAATDLDTTGGTPSFDQISSGTNTTAAMIISTGASLTVSGSGTINATTGDTATAFFSAGTIEHERGGLESDVSAVTGLLAISGGSTSEVDAKSELEAQIADVADFAEADGDVYTGTHDFGGAIVEVENSAAATVGNAGEVAVDTTADDLLYYGTAQRVVTFEIWKSFNLESPVDADNKLLFKAPYALTLTDIFCIVDPADSAESVVIDMQERNATGDTPVTVDTTITCDNDGAEDDGALSNGTIDSGDWVSIDIGTVTGTVSDLTITFVHTKDAE